MNNYFKRDPAGTPAHVTQFMARKFFAARGNNALGHGEVDNEGTDSGRPGDIGDRNRRRPIVEVICPSCERLFGFDELAEVNYVATDGGMAKPNDVFGPAEYWDEGVITCPHCGHLIDWQNT